MPASYSSPARNLFLLGSTGAQLVTNFFKQIDESASNNFFHTPSEIRYFENDDTYLIGGQGDRTSPASRKYGWVERRQEDGTEDWGIEVSSTLNLSTTLRALEVDGSNFIAVGKTADIPWVARYTTGGTFDWQATTNSGDVEYNGITSDGNGNYYACGSTTPVTNTEGTAFVEAFDSSGNPGWGKAAFMLDSRVVLNKIGANSRGEVVAVGYLQDDTAVKGYIVKIDTNTGEVLWDRTLEFNDPEGSGVQVRGITIDPYDDSIFICGNINIDVLYSGVGPVEGFIVKYTAEGNLVWQSQTERTQTAKAIYYEDISITNGIPTVLGYSRYNVGDHGAVLARYAPNGDLIWRREIDEGNTFSPINTSIDSDQSFIYLVFNDASQNETYVYGKVSTSGNGLGDFEYDDGTGAPLLQYIRSSGPNGSGIGERVGRLSDGSVRNDTSDFITYPFTGTKLLFDDLATPIANKRRQMDSADSFQYSGSPAIRPTDFSDLDVRNDTTIGPLTEIGTVVGDNVWDFSSGNRLQHPTYRLDGRTEFSVETWVKFDSLSPNQPTSSGYVWDQSPGPSGASLRADTADNFTFFVYPEPSGGVTLVDSTFTAQLNVWYHTVGVYENGTVSLYINGKLDNSTNGPAGAAVRTLQGDVPFTIGSSASTEEAPAGEIAYTTPGQYEFIVPTSVTSMNMVLVGGGGGGATTSSHLNGGGFSGAGGGGGALMWRNGLTVSAGDTLYITVGAGGSGGTYDNNSSSGNDDAEDGEDSYVRTGSHTGTIVARAGGGGAGPYNVGSNTLPTNGGLEYSSTYGGGGGDGGRGGRGQNGHQCGGGGGAGGYSGDGGSGSDGSLSNATDGSGGAGGGGGGSNSTSTFSTIHGGGGVGIYGEGVSGSAGTSQTGSNANDLANTQGFSGSGGISTDPTTSTRVKGYGGGGQGTEDDGRGNASPGAGGAVRLVWGTGRSFPTTNVGEDEIPGGVDSREYMDGEIGEVRVYPRALTPAQIFQNYNATQYKYTGIRGNTTPKLNVSPIVTNNNLLLNYDFSNLACIETSSLVSPSTYETIVDDATTNGAAFGDGQCVATGYGKVVVGARGETNGVYTSGGKAYIYNASTGALEVTLTPSDIDGNDWNFGNAVAICNCSGKIAVTSNSALYLYDADGTNEIIIDSSTTLPISPPGGNTFGNGLAISGNRVWVSDDNVPSGPNYSGTVYCFNAETGAFLYQLRPKNNLDNFIRYGVRIAAGDGVLAIGAESIAHPVTGRSNTGRVYLYTLDGRNEKILEPDDLTTSALFGTGGIAIDQGMIVVGASRQQRTEDPQKLGNGEVYVFDLAGDLKFSIRPLDDPADEDANASGFGDSVAISSDRIIVGARYYGGNPGGVMGRAYQFNHSGRELQAWFGSGGGDASDFGSSMDAAGGTLVIGAGAGSPDASGRAYIYPLTGTPSGTLFNLSNSSYTGTINGATFNSAGYFEFDGTDDDIATGLSWTPANTFSFTMWFNLDTIKEWHNLVDLYTDDTNRNFQLFVEGDGDFRIFWGATTGTSAITGTVANEWYFGAFTCDGENGTLYRYGNGTTNSVSATAASGTYSVKPLVLGRRGDSSANGFVDGKIGEFQFYQGELTSSQVLQNYNATRGKYGV